jgi:DNA-binding NarL/FixJ family response regulator
MGAVAIAVNKNGLARTPRPGGQVAINTLVVEDSKDMQAALLDLFSSLGGINVVATAATETEATDLIIKQEGDWQLVTLDLLLAEGSGFNLIHRCKAYSNAGKVVVLSDYVTPVIKLKCLNLGADAVFSKSESTHFADYVSRLVEAGAAGGPQ